MKILDYVNRTLPPFKLKCAPVLHPNTKAAATFCRSHSCKLHLYTFPSTPLCDHGLILANGNCHVFSHHHYYSYKQIPSASPKLFFLSVITLTM